jgi:hypothetical protein
LSSADVVTNNAHTHTGIAKTDNLPQLVAMPFSFFLFDKKGFFCPKKRPNLI